MVPSSDILDAVQRGLKWFVGRSRGKLRDADLAIGFVEKNKIGKGAAGINGNSVLGHSSFRLTLKFYSFNRAPG